ncbi:MAG TPA: serine/threonine-protein kinase, partial [Planctomycetaceae bacterium]
MSSSPHETSSREQRVKQAIDADLDVVGEKAASLAANSACDINDPTLPFQERGAPPPNAAARYFGDYELLAEIARGGMGVVYKARQANLNRLVALKMILSGQFANDSDVQRFYAEAEAAARLDHPGIVPIFEIGQHDGQHYFSMAFVEGESLARKVAVGPLPPREAAQMVGKVSEAVEFAHQKGIVHRDLKPANILLDRAGQPRVTDFGLAKQMHGDSGLTRSGQIMGTPSYMPPEQAAGKIDEIGPAADIYSLGAILYELLTGRPPFKGASPLDTIKQVATCEPVSPRQLQPTVPRDLETICLKCLQKAPAKRYPTAQALDEDLRRYLDGRPVKARPVGPLERGLRWVRRNSAVAALLGALIAVLAAGFVTSTLFAVSARFQAGRADAKTEEAQRETAAARTAEA